MFDKNVSLSGVPTRMVSVIAGVVPFAKRFSMFILM
jgi:hypothetical protein